MTLVEPRESGDRTQATSPISAGRGAAYKAVYAVRCPFSGPGPENFEASWELAWEWLEQKLGVERPASPAGTVAPRADCEIRWGLLSDDTTGERLASIAVLQGGTNRWVTYVWMGEQDGRAWGAIRSGPVPEPGVVAPVQFNAGRPRLVEAWINSLVVVRDGHRLTEKPRLVRIDHVDALVSFIRSERRQLPIVAITSTDENSLPLVDDRKLGRHLAGLAHLVVVHPDATGRLRDALGATHAVWDGAVRIWWPGFTSTSPAFRHRRWLPWQIDDEHRNVEEEITSVIWRAAVDAIGAPDLEHQLRARQDERRIADRVARARAESDLSDEWLQDYENTLEDLSERASRIEELEAVIADLNYELDRSRRDEPEALDAIEVQTVEEAVRLAAAEAANVVFLDSAYVSARGSMYAHPTQVLADLRAVIRVAARWANDDLPGGFAAGFAEESVRYQRDISSTAKNKYQDDYRIDYAGGVLMGPHLRRGIGAPATILRIYWYVDNSAKQLVVGHVGAKLRDQSNPG